MKLVPWKREIRMELWDHQPEKKFFNQYRGLCNTGANAPMVCALGGIGCNVDHDAIRKEQAD